jgi:acid phosphatase type 7
MAFLWVLCLHAACGGNHIAGPDDVPPTPVPPNVVVPTPPVADAILVGAGDIARCEDSNTEATAKLLDRIPGTVFTLGDNVYPTSTPQLLVTCYESTWGRHKARTLAAPGNHDWEQAAGAPYFAYFGASAGPAGLGY